MTVDAWGISEDYVDGMGHRHAPPESTRLALRAALGADSVADSVTDSVTDSVADAGTNAGTDLDFGEDAAFPPVLVVHADDDRTLPAGARVELEGGQAAFAGSGRLADLPEGVHRLTSADGRASTHLIRAPRRCVLPGDRRVWGWSVQLHALRSAESWGVGDLRDLRRLARWSADLGARVLMLNPLCVPPAPARDASPYMPCSRRFLNPLYLCVEEVTGADGEGGSPIRDVAAAARELDREPLIRRDEVMRLKLLACSRLWSRSATSDEFHRWCAAQGDALERFTAWSVLAEDFGVDCSRWPAPWSHPSRDEIAGFAREHARRLAFHAWLQWQLDLQLGRAAAELPLMQDLPVGFAHGGADFWEWQDLIAPGITFGAPPDHFNPEGQAWGFPTFAPRRLRAAGFAPLSETIRRTLRHGAGIRIDHVMGLARLFCIPVASQPRDGTYVQYPLDEMLAVLALESGRGNAFVVGEDLGAVPPGLRERLAEAGVLGTRVLWFDDRPPTDWPALSVASTSTHDLPTLAGFWSGADAALRVRLGLPIDAEGDAGARRRITEWARLREGASVPEVIERVTELLAQAPSAVVLTSLEDAMAAEVRPNLPGVPSDLWPSWSLALPFTLEALMSDALPRRLAAILSRR